MKKVTIQDIADALGISRNTVSKAINNSEGLADATRERILQKAVEMGYKQFSYFSAVSFFSALADAQGKASPGFQGEIALLTTTFLTQSHFASTMLDKFQRERVSAILCIEMFNFAYDEMICGLGIPTLFVDGPARLQGRLLPADQLYMDNGTEITRFVNEMLRQGKKRIGFVGDYLHCQSFFERYAAFRFAMLTAGVPVDERYCFRTNRLELEDVEALANLEQLPDLFLCANDFVAGDLIRALYSIGKNVPQDVCVLGFDDAPESRISRPALSTVHIHTQVMAFSAVQLLVSRMKEPSLDYRTIHTQTDLILRESTVF